MLTLTAFAVLGFTEQDPAVPCTARRPPDDDDFEEVTVYRGFNKKGTSPGSFVPDDGLSTYKILIKEYDFKLPFRVRYKGKKRPGTTGQIIFPPIGLTATYDGVDQPGIGIGHWNLNLPGKTGREMADILSQYAKKYKNGQPFP